MVALWADGMGIGAIAALTAAPRDTVLSRKKYALAKLRVLMRSGRASYCGLGAAMTPQATRLPELPEGWVV